jgi:hypothetical protein
MSPPIAECLDTLGVGGVDSIDCSNLNQEWTATERPFLKQMPQCHPDKGGETEVFLQVKAGVESLEQVNLLQRVDSFDAAIHTLIPSVEQANDNIPLYEFFIITTSIAMLLLLVRMIFTFVIAVARAAPTTVLTVRMKARRPRSPFAPIYPSSDFLLLIGLSLHPVLALALVLLLLRLLIELSRRPRKVNKKKKQDHSPIPIPVNDENDPAGTPPARTNDGRRRKSLRLERAPGVNYKETPNKPYRRCRRRSSQ